MSEADALYAAILDQRLRSELTVQRLEEKALELHAEGRTDVARALIGRALEGSALMPNLKQRLREFSKTAFEPDAATD